MPIIDLFAGPGGLGEGFAAFRCKDGPRFRIGLSIEKDSAAHHTLELRAFFRQFADGEVPPEYYSFARGELSREALFNSYPEEARAAREEAWRAELGRTLPADLNARIRQAIGGHEGWVLIGGPPCQAYSLVGRSRNKGVKGYRPEQDERQTLYREYLKVIADHWPAVFVMENVKGLLSAELGGKGIFDRIREDLQDPAAALGRGRSNRGVRRYRYRLLSLVDYQEVGQQFALLTPDDARAYIVRAERFGIPQARHRVILLGVREDLRSEGPLQLTPQPEIPAIAVLKGVPELRSGISDALDSDEEWMQIIRGLNTRHALSAIRAAAGREVVDTVERVTAELRPPRAGRGGTYVRSKARIFYASEWFLDPQLQGVCNHSSRRHMTADLQRYFYASCYAVTMQRSPALRHFPGFLLPKHRNVQQAIDGSLFGDRFRVQIASRPATTVTSHLSKDGHYYIHPDPAQCRSLTVREAARLQTFPDNYFFCGGRTAQYQQVGNAVPPLLARQIAEVVNRIVG